VPRYRKIRHRFLDELLTAFGTQFAAPSANINLVLTLRADFFGQALSYRPFADALQYNDLKLGPMALPDLQDAIEKPAQSLNVIFEEGLKDRILNTVLEQPLYLAITEYIMMLLWQKRRERMLTHAAYNEIGDVKEIVENYFLHTSYLPTLNAYHLGININPPLLSVGQLTSVRVELLPAEPGNSTLMLPADMAEVYCFISADGFEVRGSEVAKMGIHPRTQDVTPAHFELQARLRGSRRCIIELFVEDPQTGRTSIFQSEEIVTVITPSASEELIPLLPALEVRVSQTGFVLEVKTQPLSDENAYELTYHLTCRLPGLQISNQKVGVVEMSAAQIRRL
jgi:hypothetical protein